MDEVVNLDANVAIFYGEALKILSKYPKLEILRKDNTVFLSGELDLIDDAGFLQDSYFIEIHPTENYPFQFPYLYEKGGKIPLNIDWHVYNDGHCCIKTMPEEWLTCKNGISLDYFILSEVIPYLFNQTFRRLNGYFLNERSHGILGEIEFFQELFATKSLSKIISWLIFVMTNQEPNRVSDCFCGSKIRYRLCHREAFRKLKKLDSQELMLILKQLVLSPHYFKANPTEAVRLRKVLTNAV